MMINRTNDHHEEGRGCFFFFDSSSVVRAFIRQVAALGHFIPLQRHNVPSLRLVQKSRGCHKPRHTSSYSTACSIRSNAKWRPSHRTPKLLVVLLPVAFGVCGRKRLHCFHASAPHTGRNVLCAVPSFSQTVCPLCLQVFLVSVDVLDLSRR